ncbi:MAG: hypothetical protein JW384_02129 [Nitrosomonadaceae bacterium]|nr:hypothetical protein [Nitrosomonadaceae bacterium]
MHHAVGAVMLGIGACGVHVALHRIAGNGRRDRIAFGELGRRRHRHDHQYGTRRKHHLPHAHKLLNCYDGKDPHRHPAGLSEPSFA